MIVFVYDKKISINFNNSFKTFNSKKVPKIWPFQVFLINKFSMHPQINFINRTKFLESNSDFAYQSLASESMNKNLIPKKNWNIVFFNLFNLYIYIFNIYIFELLAPKYDVRDVPVAVCKDNYLFKVI